MRKLWVLVLLLVVSISNAAPPLYQERDGIEPKNLPKGVSATEAQRIFQTAEVDGDRQIQALRSRRKRQLDQIQSITARARAALKRVLEADRTGTYKNYLSDVARIGKIQGAAELRQALRELEGKYLTFFEAAFKQANINEADLKAKISRVLPGAKFGPLLTVTGREPEGPEDEEQSPKAHSVLQDTQTFEAPYGIRSTKKFGQGISGHVLTASANRDTGNISASAGVTAVIGNAEAKAAVGQAVEAPSGLSSVRGTIETDSNYNMVAVGVVAVSGAWVDELIEIDKPNGTRRTRVHNFGWVVAPIGWFAELSGEDEPLTITKSVVSPAAGGQFSIKARIITSGYCYGLFGLGRGAGGAKLNKITVAFRR